MVPRGVRRLHAGAEPYIPATKSLRRLSAAVQDCRGCDLYRDATRAVFGRGPRDAALMLIGEQPGHSEDLEGAPFVGPAGELLDRALERVADDADGRKGVALKEAHDEVEDQEDEHLYHTTGWCRELWIASLGMPSVLPPPEEEKEVKTAIGAARAKQAREEML